MENNRLTAVDWLAEQIKFTNKELYAELFEDILDSKQMMEEQIKDAYRVGKAEKTMPNELSKTATQYYNETYEQN